MQDILVTENIAGEEMDALKGAFQVTFDPQLWKDREKLLRAVADHRAIIVRKSSSSIAIESNNDASGRIRPNC